MPKKKRKAQTQGQQEKPSAEPTAMKTVSQKDFQRSPQKILRDARQGGPIAIAGENGDVQMVVGASRQGLFEIEPPEETDTPTQPISEASKNSWFE